MSKHDPTFWTRLSIATLAPAVLAAGILFLVSGSRARQTVSERDAFAQFAETEAQKALRDSTPPGIAPMVRPTIAPEQRERLEAMELEYQSQLYRRGITGGFALGGTMTLLVLGGFWVLVRKTAPAEAPAAHLPHQ